MDGIRHGFAGQRAMRASEQPSQFQYPALQVQPSSFLQECKSLGRFRLADLAGPDVVELVVHRLRNQQFVVLSEVRPPLPRDPLPAGLLQVGTCMGNQVSEEAGLQVHLRLAHEDTSTGRAEQSSHTSEFVQQPAAR